MQITTLALGSADYPEKLSKIDGAPQTLYCLGAPLLQLLKKPSVAVVGSRTVTAYGRQVTYDFVRSLAEQGVVIISGLAYGVDAVAHRAALDAGGITIAVLPTALNNVYPAGHRPLAREILESGGAVVSEYQATDTIYKINFVARNRIVAGLADTLLITEAAQRSGTMHTAHFALEQGRPVFAVPGAITNPKSAGTNNLLKTQASPATSVKDIFQSLNMKLPKRHQPKSSDPRQQTLLNLLQKGTSDGDQLLAQSQLPISDYNQALTMLEFTDKIYALGANQWAIK